MPRSLLLVLALGLSNSLGGQTPVPATSLPEYQLSVVLGSGGTLGGPANAMVDELEAAGYDRTAPGGCFLVVICVGPTSYPYARAPHGSTTGIAVRYALKRTFALGLGTESGGIGGASGFGPNGYLTTEWEATSVWTAAYWTPSRGFRLGAGPSIHTLSQGTAHPKEHRVGITGEMGVQFPRRSHLFCDIAARYHLIPTTEVEVGTPGTPAVMSSEPHWSHFNLLFGLGLRM